MGKFTKQDIIELISEEDVKFIRLQFTDIFGRIKNVAITSTQFERMAENRMRFDGTSIGGFSSVEKSDMYLIPDFDTFEIFPWRPQQGKVARMICDVCTPDGTPFTASSRFVLKKVIENAKEMGYDFEVGPECEFFLFNTDENGNPTNKTSDDGGYFDLAPIDHGENCRREICLTLEDMDFEIESSYHEAAKGQHEIVFRHDDALTTADRIMTFRLVVKTIAKRHGLHATFMPKPIYDSYGSGMHINMALTKDGVNVFDDPSDKLGLSKTAYHFMAGILKYAPEYSFITNPLVNSYKRFVPGFEAPCYIAWSANNRTQLVRIPLDRGEDARIELRSPDPSANPYLVIAMCLAAGLEGIRQKLVPPSSVDSNIFNMTNEERRERGIKNLPISLRDALNIAKGSEFARDVLGDHLFEAYVKAKEKEYDAYRTRICQWELDEYLTNY